MMKYSIGPDHPGPLQPESRFIAPTPRCPAPERWHSTDADSTELQVSALIRGLVEGLQPRCVIETGTGFGQTAGCIAMGLWAGSRRAEARFITFESSAARREAFVAAWGEYAPTMNLQPLVGWPDGTARDVYPADDPAEAEDRAWASAMILHPSMAEQFPGWAAVGWPDQVIDFAFFDSFYEARAVEFLHFRQWMRRGTICAFHDTAPGHGRNRFAELDMTWDKIDPGNRAEFAPDLRELLGFRLRDLVRWIDLPTPRGLSLAEVL